MNIFSKVMGMFGKKEEEISQTISKKEEEPKEEKVLLDKKEKKVIGKSSEKWNYKFSGDQVMKILYWIAIFTPHKEIVLKIKEEFGIDVSVHTVKYYSCENEDYKNTIRKIREKWGQDITDLEFAHKKRRIQEIQKIYNKCIETNQMRNALSAVQQIQGEVEKAQNVGTQTNYQINIYKDMTEEELEEERIKSLERIKMLKQIPEIKAEDVPNEQ